MVKRQPGLDLIRLLALLFVITFHSFLNNGYYLESQTGIAMWIAGSLRWLSVSCIGLFLMLTGYLKSTKTTIRSCYYNLLTVLLGYLLAAAITIPIRHFIFSDVQPLSIWITRLFNFSAIYYGWYVEMYIGLVLICPFINMALNQLNETKKLLLFIGIMLIITALPGATRLTLAPDYWRNIYPVTYYILGATIKKIQPKIHPLTGIAGALFMSALLGTATVLSTNERLYNALTWEFADLWIVVITVCLFTALYNLNIRTKFSKILAFGAKGCYGGYLISHLLDAWCYNLFPTLKTPNKYFLLFGAVTVPIFLMSVLSGRILQKLTDLILHRKEHTLC